MRDTALHVGDAVPPFRVFDRETAEATGEIDDGYFAARELFGEDKWKNEDGTIKTLNDALLTRYRMAEAYKFRQENLEIHDATGNRVCEKFIDVRDRTLLFDWLNEVSARRGFGGNAPTRSYPAGYQPGQTMCAGQPETAGIIAAWAARDDLRDESSLWPPTNS
jgi:hypothetical protein